MKTTRLFCLLIIVIAVSSCAFHSGIMNDSASLHGQDFELLGMAEGRSSTTHVLGIGGLNPLGLVAEAKRAMYNRYPLKKGQAYANISVDFKRSYFFLVNTTTAMVTADIVQFGEEESEELQSLFKNGVAMMNLIELNKNVEIGIMVNGELRKVNMIKMENTGHRTVMDSSGNVYSKIKSSMLYDLREGAMSKDGVFSVGNKVRFITSIASGGKSGESIGIVMGISERYVAIRNELMLLQVPHSDVIEVVK